MARDSFRDLAEFFGSTALSLRTQGQRVRNLIGESHWQSDGTYKERLLKQAIREIIPSAIKVGDGFLIYRKNNEKEYEVSRQIDVLVYDDRFVAPIFHDGDFVIILAETALAAIEVKSSWGENYAALKDGVRKLQSAHHLYRLARKSFTPNLFTACIAYAYAPKLKTQKLGSVPLLKKFAPHFKKEFIDGLSKYWGIGPNIEINDLERINHQNLVTSLCPQMTLSLDIDWILVPGETNSADLNKWNQRCPIIKQVSTISRNEKDKSINHSLHLFLGTLRHRCIEWLNHNRGIPEFEALKSHLSTFIFSDRYPTISDLYALIPAIEGIDKMFPKVKFTD